MTPSNRRSISRLSLLLAALVVGLALAGIALSWLWPEQDLRERITRQASAHLGTQVTITGDISPQIWPGPGIRAEHVTIAPLPGSTQQDAPIATLGAIEVSLRWLPLLRGEPVPKRVTLDQPTIHLDPATLGALQAAGEGRTGETTSRLGPIDLAIDNGAIDWQDEAHGLTLSASGIDLDAPAVRWSTDEHEPSAVPLSAGKTRLSASSVKINGLGISDLSLHLVGEDGGLRTEDWQMTVLGDRGTGKGTVELGATEPRSHLELAFDALDLARLPDTWLPGGHASGQLALQASLTGHGRGQALWRHLNGQVRLGGEGLVLHGMDLDAELAEYQRTQRFSLVDAAAVAFMGPAGLVATKGSDFARLAGRTDGGETRIRQLVSDWEIKDGIARANDVALATPRNRLAVQATLDLARQTITQATVAAVDQRGCAVMKQSLHGPFSAPQAEATSMAEGLLGAPIDLLRRGLNAISGGKTDCEVFYQGSVSAPSG